MKKLLLLTSLLLTLFLQAQVGIGTAIPNNSAMLDVQSSNKGFLPPRMSLLSETDGTTIPSPANGLIVFHTGAGLNGSGIYSNLGTPASPKWSLLQAQNSSNGYTSIKSSYTGETDPSRIYTLGNLEFRLNTASGSVNFEIRMRKAPTVNMTYNGNRLSWYQTGANSAQASVTFTPANWNTWQAYNTSGNNGVYTVAFQVYVNSLQDPTFYEIKLNTRYGSGYASSDKYWNQVYIAY